MKRIIHTTQMVSLTGQRLDNPDLTDDEVLDLLEELYDWCIELEFRVNDELYMRTETIDGRHS